MWRTFLFLLFPQPTFPVFRIRIMRFNKIPILMSCRWLLLVNMTVNRIEDKNYIEEKSAKMPINQRWSCLVWQFSHSLSFFILFHFRSSFVMLNGKMKCKKGDLKILNKLIKFSFWNFRFAHFSNKRKILNSVFFGWLHLLCIGSICKILSIYHISNRMNNVPFGIVAEMVIWEMMTHHP